MSLRRFSLIAHDEAGGLFLDRPGRRLAAGPNRKLRGTHAELNGDWGLG
jgi:hypothetical protein